MSDSLNCNYCGELDDLTYFITCSRLSGLFQLTQNLIRIFTPRIHKIPVCWYIIGIPASSGLLSMLDVWATGFRRSKKLQLFIVDTTKTGVVGLIV